MSGVSDRGQLEAFVRAIELGSFSAAARELKLTPSALSKLVLRLERSLKARLVNRTTRSLKPTPEGEIFHARCRQILAELADAESEVTQTREHPRGRLRMHVGVGLATYLIEPQLPVFLERYPEIELDLTIEDRVVDFERENFDIFVGQSAPESQSLVVRRLFDCERVICASPQYLKRHGKPRTPDELPGHRCMSVSTMPNHSYWRFRAPDGERVIEMPRLVRANNVNCVCRLAIAGVGIARFAEYIAADALRNGQLVQLLAKEHISEHLVVNAVSTPERHRLPRVAVMLDFLVEAFGHRPWRNLRRRREQ